MSAHYEPDSERLKRSLKRVIPSAVIYAVYVLGYMMGARTRHPNGLIVWLVTGATLLAWAVFVGWLADRWFAPVHREEGEG